MFDSKAG